jgi:hypothetical protein
MYVIRYYTLIQKQHNVVQPHTLIYTKPLNVIFSRWFLLSSFQNRIVL